MSVFDDPFIIASINARTRAMNKFDCEIEGLRPERVRTLYYEVAGMYRPGSDMVLIIERVLDLNEPFTNDAERGAYKIAIGMAMHEVRKLLASRLEELDRSHPQVPIEIYEQEM